MKIYLLDTDQFSLFERGHPSVVNRFGLTIITAK